MTEHLGPDDDVDHKDSDTSCGTCQGPRAGHQSLRKVFRLAAPISREYLSASRLAGCAALYLAAWLESAYILLCFGQGEGSWCAVKKGFYLSASLLHPRALHWDYPLQRNVK